MTTTRIELARARSRLQGALRAHLSARGFDEVETPCLVPAPGMEPHIRAFEAPFVPEGGGAPRPLWLHSSPEYAMKRLLADGFERIFQLARVFRNGEVSDTHNPEFTMLEMYRAGTDHRGIMEDLEQAVEAGARALHPGAGRSFAGAGTRSTGRAPFDRLRGGGRPSPAPAWTSKPAARTRASCARPPAPEGSTPGRTGRASTTSSSGSSSRRSSRRSDIHAPCT